MKASTPRRTITLVFSDKAYLSHSASIVDQVLKQPTIIHAFILQFQKNVEYV